MEHIIIMILLNCCIEIGLLLTCDQIESTGIGRRVVVISRFSQLRFMVTDDLETISLLLDLIGEPCIS